MSDSKLPPPPTGDPAGEIVSRSHKPDDTHYEKHMLYPDDVALETTDELMLKFLNIP